MKQRKGSDFTIQEWLERVLYLIGALLIRKVRHLQRRSRRGLRRLYWNLRLRADDLKQERRLQRRQHQVGAQKNAIARFREQRRLMKDG